METRPQLPDEEIGSWLEREVAGCQFHDTRHGKRFRTLLGQLSDQIGGSIPFACQDWASTKAAYRFLSNERISEEKILAGHFSAHVNDSQPLATLRFWSFTTRLSSPITARPRSDRHFAE